MQSNAVVNVATEKSPQKNATSLESFQERMSTAVSFIKDTFGRGKKKLVDAMETASKAISHIKVEAEEYILKTKDALELSLYLSLAERDGLTAKLDKSLEKISKIPESGKILVDEIRNFADNSAFGKKYGELAKPSIVAVASMVETAHVDAAIAYTEVEHSINSSIESIKDYSAEWKDFGRWFRAQYTALYAQESKENGFNFSRPDPNSFIQKLNFIQRGLEKSAPSPEVSSEYATLVDAAKLTPELLRELQANLGNRIPAPVIPSPSTELIPAIPALPAIPDADKAAVTEETITPSPDTKSDNITSEEAENDAAREEAQFADLILDFKEGDPEVQEGTGDSQVLSYQAKDAGIDLLEKPSHDEAAADTALPICSDDTVIESNREAEEAAPEKTAEAEDDDSMIRTVDEVEKEEHQRLESENRSTESPGVVNAEVVDEETEEASNAKVEPEELVAEEAPPVVVAKPVFTEPPVTQHTLPGENRLGEELVKALRKFKKEGQYSSRLDQQSGWANIFMSREEKGGRIYVVLQGKNGAELTGIFSPENFANLEFSALDRSNELGNSRKSLFSTPFVRSILATGQATIKNINIKSANLSALTEQPLAINLENVTFEEVDLQNNPNLTLKGNFKIKQTDMRLSNITLNCEGACDLSDAGNIWPLSLKGNLAESKLGGDLSHTNISNLKIASVELSKGPITSFMYGFRKFNAENLGKKVFEGSRAVLNSLPLFGRSDKIGAAVSSQLESVILDVKWKDGDSRSLSANVKLLSKYSNALDANETAELLFARRKNFNEIEKNFDFIAAALEPAVMDRRNLDGKAEYVFTRPNGDRLVISQSEKSHRCIVSFEKELKGTGSDGAPFQKEVIGTRVSIDNLLANIPRWAKSVKPTPPAQDRNVFYEQRLKKVGLQRDLLHTENEVQRTAA